MNDGDYLLGTHDDEIARLGIQHRVWRAQMLAGFQAARFASGQTILDVGAGPGFATADLSETVGPDGKIIAFERSPNFLAALRARDLPNVEVRDADVVEQDFGEGIADGAWTRWVLAFVSDPARTVAHIAQALKPGGVALFHEYIDYESWRLIPRNEEQLLYRGLLVKSWRDSGGEPDAALDLPRYLAMAGLELVAIRPMVEIITADDPSWEWPASFIAINAIRLHELGYCSAEDAASFANMLDRAPLGTHMLTPVVAEIIARKR